MAPSLEGKECQKANRSAKCLVFAPLGDKEHGKYKVKGHHMLLDGTLKKKKPVKMFML